MELTVPKTFIRYVGNSLHATDYTRSDAWVERIKYWLGNGLHELYFFMHMHEEAFSPELTVYLVDKLNAELAEKCGQDAPPSSKIREALERCLQIVTTVGGPILQNTPVAPYANITHVVFTVTPGLADVKVKKGQSLSLAPGAYGEVEVADDATLVLSAGRYFLKEIRVGQRSTIHFNLTNGPAIIDVKEGVHFEQFVSMVIDGPVGRPDDIFFRIEQGRVELEQDGTFLGTYLDIGGDIHLEKRATLHGALWGRTVEIDDKCVLTPAMSYLPVIDLFLPTIL